LFSTTGRLHLEGGANYIIFIDSVDLPSTTFVLELKSGLFIYLAILMSFDGFWERLVLEDFP